MDSKIFVDPNEEYIKRCGEIFLTTIGNIIFHCTLCDMKCKGFEKYADHVRAEHLLSIIVSNGMQDTTEVYNELSENNNKELEQIVDHVETIEDENYNSIYNDEVKEEHIELLDEVSGQYIDIKEDNNENVNFEIVDGDYEVMTLEEYSSIPQELEENFVVEDDFINDEEQNELLNCNSNETNITIENIIRETTTNIEISGGIRRTVRKRTVLNPTPMELRKHKCPICGAAFKDKNNMHYHLKRHSNSKNCKCPECDKRFYTNSEVRVHLRTHSLSRPYLCNECGHTFLTNAHLVNHIKRHTDQRDFKCDECGMSFYENRHLRDHMAKHTGVRPYSCEHCDASFYRKKSLSRHMKLHENKKEYKCQWCNAAYNQITSLRQHLKSVHDE